MQILGNYIGIVVNNKDPERRGRVQVFVPHLSATIQKKWNLELKDLNFKAFGENIRDPISGQAPQIPEEVRERLCKILPWAEQAMPIFGPGTSNSYLPGTKKAAQGNVTRALDGGENYVPYDQILLNQEQKTGQPLAHPLGIKEKPETGLAPSQITPTEDPGKIPIESKTDQLSAFIEPKPLRAEQPPTDEKEKGLNRVFNTSSATCSLAPKAHSNMPRGMFSIPDINAKVWVFFNGGDLMFPVYFAICPEPTEMQSYYENESSPSSARHHDDDKHYNRTSGLITEAGGMELVTQITTAPGAPVHNNSVRIFHSSGSHISLSNGNTFYYDTANRVEKISKAHHVTVIGEKVAYTGGDENIIISGNNRIHIGNHSKKEIEATENIIKSLHEIQKERNDIKLSSTLVPCPICGDGKSKRYLYPPRSVSLGFLRFVIPPYLSFPIDFIEWMLKMLRSFILLEKPGFQLLEKGKCDNPNCKGGFIPTIQPEVEKARQKGIAKSRALSKDIAKNEAKLGVGGSTIANIQKDLTVQVGLKMNDVNPYVRIKNGEPHANSVDFSPKELAGIINGGTCDSIVYNEPYSTPGGTMHLVAMNEAKLTAGARGVSIETIGRFSTRSGDVAIIAAHDAVLGSDNRTTVSGNCVTIEAKDNQQGGVLVSADKTLVAGKLGVTGNLTVSGSVGVAGNVYAKTLVMPTMREKTQNAGRADIVEGHAMWATNGAIAWMAANIAKKALTHWTQIGYLMTVTGLYDVWSTYYYAARVSLFIEPTITGICLTPCGGGIVINFTHTHRTFTEDHTHDYRLPHMVYCNDDQDLAKRMTATNGVAPTIGIESGNPRWNA